MNASVGSIGVIQHIVGPSGLQQLHRRLSRKAGQGLGTEPAIGNERRAEARFNLVEDLDQFAQALLGAGLTDAHRSLDRIFARACRTRQIFSIGQQYGRNRLRGAKDLQLIITRPPQMDPSSSTREDP